MSDDWSQIDVKKVAEPEVDFEIDEEVRAEEAAAKAPLEIEEEADNTIEVDPAAPDPDPAESVPELAGVDTEGAQKRIRQLVRQRKEREEHIIVQQQQIA